MIEYDKEKKQINIGYCVSWECTVKRVYEEISDDYRASIEDGDITAEKFPPKVEELTEDQIDYIMDCITDELDNQDNYDDTLNVDDAIHKSVEEWVDYYCNGEI